AAAVVVAAVGVAVLAGWTFDVELLRSGVPGLTAMNPGGTAMAFVLGGTSLWVLAPTPHGRRRVVGRALAAAVVLIGGLGCAGYLLGWQNGPDQWLFHDEMIRDAARFGFANRMAPNTAVALVAVGTSLVLLAARGRRAIWVAHGLAL